MGMELGVGGRTRVLVDVHVIYKTLIHLHLLDTLITANISRMVTLFEPVRRSVHVLILTTTHLMFFENTCWDNVKPESNTAFTMSGS